MNVLIAHDDREFRRWLGLGLKLKGCTVGAIPSLAALTQAASELKPDVLLLEPKLLEGLSEPVARIVWRYARKPVAVLVLTYWAGPEKADLLRGHGVSLLAARPEDLDAMILQMKQMVATAQAAAKAAAATPAPWEGAGSRAATGSRAAVMPAPPAKQPAPPQKLPVVAKAEAAAARPPRTGEEPTASSLSAQWLFEGVADVLEEEPPAVEARVDPASVLRPYREDGTGFRVLVIDDDPTFRAFLCEALAENGFRTYFTNNAPNALRALKCRPEIDLIVSDLHMPHMDGFELKDEFDRWSDSLLPFVMVTADPREQNREIARQIGAHALIGKPITDMKGFVRTLNQAICSIPRRETPP